jgi:glycosyltransferase involved in cell wall biosynthesis
MTSSNRKTVAMIMPIRNDAASIKPSMDAIFASTRLPDEIVVADGLSTDGTRDLIAQYQERGIPIRIVSNPTLWAGGGRNLAVHETECDVLVLNDFGNIIDPDYIEAIVRPFEEDGDVDLVCGMFEMQATTDFEHCVAAIHYSGNYMLDKFRAEDLIQRFPRVVLPGGLCTAVTRRAWLAAGGQPEWLAKGQDKLFSRKIYALGYRSAVAIDARLKHHVRRNSTELFRQVFFYGRGNGQMQFMSRHVLHLILIYGLILALLALGSVNALFALFGIVLFFLYAWHSGVRKIIQADGGLKKRRYIPIALEVLLVRDIGSILGHIVGWVEWLVRPKFRQKFSAYMHGLPADRIFVLAPGRPSQSFLRRMRHILEA